MMNTNDLHYHFEAHLIVAVSNEPRATKTRSLNIGSKFLPQKRHKRSQSVTMEASLSKVHHKVAPPRTEIIMISMYVYACTYLYIYINIYRERVYIYNMCMIQDSHSPVQSLSRPVPLPLFRPATSSLGLGPPGLSESPLGFAHVTSIHLVFIWQQKSCFCLLL